jgi:hypothetical protein
MLKFIPERVRRQLLKLVTCLVNNSRLQKLSKIGLWVSSPSSMIYGKYGISLTLVFLIKLCAQEISPWISHCDIVIMRRHTEITNSLGEGQ